MKTIPKILLPLFVLPLFLFFFSSCGHTHRFSVTTLYPSCEAGGYSHYVCGDCGYEYDDDLTEPLGHAFGDFVTVREPSREGKGLIRSSCARCDATVERETENEFTVTVYLNGELADTYDAYYNDPLSLPTVKAPALGYVFSGWHDDAGRAVNGETPIRRDLTVSGAVIHDALDLPILVIHTENGAPVKSKETYLSATVTLTNTDDAFELTDLSARIKGRGNSSWGMDKKPYKLKFDQKQSLFGSSYRAKTWTLIANHSDKTLCRNALAYELAERFPAIAFSSTHVFVDLYLNDQYLGVYLLCDQIETGKGRVEIDESLADPTDVGFLIELDGRAPNEGVLDRDYFALDGLNYTIKTPDTESAEFLSHASTYVSTIQSFLGQCRDAILTQDFDEISNVIDVPSFVETYIIQEVFANKDCNFASFFLYRDKGGKLTAGPVWDFDIAAGNINYNIGNIFECPPDKRLYASSANTWYRDLLKCEEVKALVAEALTTYHDTILSVIALADLDNPNGYYALYRDSLLRNFEKWHIMGKYVWPEPESVYRLATIEKQFIYLSDWLRARLAFVEAAYLK